ncbi:exo-alpha-sialidase [Candidatus Uhrbacteria bacterium]|nr:exo-alpha-sialidase [Candidatus Uhrbacteria bacterium]
MHKTFQLFVAFIGVLVLTLGCLYFFYRPITESISIPSDDVVTEEVKENEEQSEIVYYMPVGKEVDLSKNGPWKNSLNIAFSEDGTTFTAQTALVEKAGVPSLTQMQDGRLLLVFQWFEDGDWFDYPALMFSEDQGQTWRDPEPMKLIGYPDDWGVPFDPAVVTLPDGRIRMYFTVNPERFSGSTDTYISSAVSEDGLIYTYEAGVRFEDTDIDLTRDSTVGYLDGEFHLFSPSHETDGEMNHGVSQNGLDFTVEEDITDGEYIIWLGDVTTSTAGLRFYGFEKASILWADSSDGFSWTDEVKTNLMGADPAAVRLEDGSYVVVVTSIGQKQ